MHINPGIMRNDPHNCYGCKERHLGCHSDCEKYAAWKARYEEKKFHFYKQRKEESIIHQYEVKATCKVTRQKEKET